MLETAKQLTTIKPKGKERPELPVHRVRFEVADGPSERIPIEGYLNA